MIGKVYIDTDIILDLVLERKPHSLYAAQLFSSIEQNQIKGFASPLIFSNLYYILRKGKSRSEALNVLRKLKLLLTIVPIHEKILDRALLSEVKGFEDAMQYYAAVENEIPILITRNKKDYPRKDISILTAEEYFNLKNIHDSELECPSKKNKR